MRSAFSEKFFLGKHGGSVSDASGVHRGQRPPERRAAVWSVSVFREAIGQLEAIASTASWSHQQFSQNVGAMERDLWSPMENIARWKIRDLKVRGHKLCEVCMTRLRQGERLLWSSG